MKTFREYITWAEGQEDPMIAKTVSDLALKDPKIIPGATDQKNAARIMRDAAVQKLTKKDPAAAGKLGQVLTGQEPGITANQPAQS
jgi:hypothetical protein